MDDTDTPNRLELDPKHPTGIVDLPRYGLTVEFKPREHTPNGETGSGRKQERASTGLPPARTPDDLATILSAIPDIEKETTRETLVDGLPNLPNERLRNRRGIVTEDLTRIVAEAEEYSRQIGNSWTIGRLIQNAMSLIEDEKLERSLQRAQREYCSKPKSEQPAFGSDARRPVDESER
jgi:hypothetical protein